MACPAPGGKPLPPIGGPTSPFVGAAPQPLGPPPSMTAPQAIGPPQSIAPPRAIGPPAAVQVPPSGVTPGLVGPATSLIAAQSTDAQQFAPSPFQAPIIRPTGSTFLR